MDSVSKSLFDLYAQDAALDAELLHEAYVAALAEAATYRQCFLAAIDRLAELGAEVVAAHHVQQSQIAQIRQLMGVSQDDR